MSLMLGEHLAILTMKHCRQFSVGLKLCLIKRFREQSLRHHSNSSDAARTGQPVLPLRGLIQAKRVVGHSSSLRADPDATLQTSAEGPHMHNDQADRLGL